MKKILKTNWERYKRSSEGQEVIAMFNLLTTPKATVEDMLTVIKRFNSEISRNTTEAEERQELETLSFYNNLIKEILQNTEKDCNVFNSGEFFVMLTHSLAVEDEATDMFDAPQIGFKRILGSNIYLSMVLYANMPDYYIPNLFIMQFAYFKKFAEKYELELPEMPKRSDYRMRWLYYLQMCNAIDSFAVENDLLDPGELCAFLFDYELTNIKEEMEIEHNKPMPVVPEQAWILVGNYSEGEKSMKEGVWQSNQLTCKGDIMLFYEKSPVKKLNAVWTALEDGFIDPFGPYYSYSIIGKRIIIPDDKAITFEEFKNSEYFKKENYGSEGNFVSKNFQDVSGWAVTSDDYAEIKRMLKAKGFDTTVLPSLYKPQHLAGVEIANEKDVEDKLLKPLLEEMGWKHNEDYFQQVEFPSGRGTTKRPDFCLHLTKKDKDIEAQVVIEVKKDMKNIEGIEANFYQGQSYAKWGGVRALVLCDKNQIRVYERNKNNKFDINHYVRFRWEEMQVLEKYNELKRMLSKR